MTSSVSVVPANGASWEDLQRIVRHAGLLSQLPGPGLQEPGLLDTLDRIQEACYFNETQGRGC